MAIAAPPTAPPTAPVWPAQWHADITITGPVTLPAASSASTPQDDPIITLLPASASGQYYYDSTNSRTATVLTDSVTGQRLRSVTTASTGVSVDVDGPTGVCRSVVLSSNYTRWSVLPPNFVSVYGMVFIGNEYYLRDGSFRLTQHWSWNNSLVPTSPEYAQIDYYHGEMANAPFRMIWTLGSNLDEPVVMDVSTNVMAGFDDISPQLAYLFGVPNSCTHTPTRAELSRESVQEEGAEREMLRAAPSPVGTPWPYAFWAAVAYTGNDFGLPTPDLDKYVQQTLFGYYYYDWNNSRESSYWRDGGLGGSGARTKTTIVNGAFHAIDLQTGTCVIPPTAPVNGPLKPEWPTQLSYVDTQAIRMDLNPSPIGNGGIATTTFALADHYRFDAFGAGPDHSFNYWQRDNLPLQFNGTHHLTSTDPVM